MFDMDVAGDCITEDSSPSIRLIGSCTIFELCWFYRYIHLVLIAKYYLSSCPSCRMSVLSPPRFLFATCFEGLAVFCCFPRLQVSHLIGLQLACPMCYSCSQVSIHSQPHRKTKNQHAPNLKCHHRINLCVIVRFLILLVSQAGSKCQ